MRTLYVCQACGEEVGEGEQDRNRRHAYCGGTLDPVGEIEDDEETSASAVEEMKS